MEGLGRYNNSQRLESSREISSAILENNLFVGNELEIISRYQYNHYYTTRHKHEH